MSEYRVNVYASATESECGGPIVARVRYNQALDEWDGRNWTSGGVGQHLGITKLKTGEYVLIHGTQWQGAKDYAYIVSDMEALQAILAAGQAELLDMKKYKKLKDLAAEKGLLDSELDEMEAE